MWDYSPTKGNLASRDVVSRSMMRHIKAGFGVHSPYGDHLWLDIKRLGEKHIRENLRDVDYLCRTFVGIDPTKEYIPVRPAQHYTMFGIKTNKECEAYGLEHLFAIGEAACWDLHGFNRLGGNSLLETIASGYFAGRNALKYLGPKVQEYCVEAKIAQVKDEDRIYRLLNHNVGTSAVKILAEIQNTMTEYVGIFRNDEDMKTAFRLLQRIYVEKILDISVRTKEVKSNQELSLALRLPGMAKMALCTIYSALIRKESRGSHFREDYPTRDDKNCLYRTLAYFYPIAEEPTLHFEPIKIDRLPPGDRGYGEKA